MLAPNWAAPPVCIGADEDEDEDEDERVAAAWVVATFGVLDMVGRMVMLPVGLTTDELP